MSDLTVTIEGITKRLEAIRDERTPYANTATRIGEALLSLLSLYKNTPFVKKTGEERLVIGDIYLSWDKENNAIKVSKADGSAANFYTVGGISAYGTGPIPGGGGGGASYERLDRWEDYTTAKATAILSAFLGNDLNERLKQVEAGALTSVDWSIIKNKPTSMPASDVPAWAKAPTKPTYSWNEIAQQPTTLQGYGIIDAKIAGSTITLGTNSITPLTAHQPIYALTLQRNGAAVGIFNPKNANATLDIAVPTKVSELTNDVGFITAAANTATATRLQTARTFWGQQFDGTGNVDGVLTVKHAGTAGIFLTSTSDESSFSCECTGSRRWVFGGYPTRFFIWNSAAKQVLSILNNGNVVIGDTELNSPYKLNVKGSMRVGDRLYIAGAENSDITTVRNANSTIKNVAMPNAAIRHALDFGWYSTHYQVGNIRGGGTDSLGFGITKDNSTLIARFHENGTEVYSDLAVGGYLSLSNNKGLRLKDKEGKEQRALFISNSNSVYFG